MNYAILIYGIKLTKDELDIVKSKERNYKDWIFTIKDTVFMGIIQKFVKEEDFEQINTLNSPPNTLELISILYKLNISSKPSHYLICHKVD